MPCRLGMILLACWSCLLACPNRLNADPPPEAGSPDQDTVTAGRLTDEWNSRVQSALGGRVGFLVRSYDHTFAVERLGEGWLTWTDRNNWTLTTRPVEITSQMREARAKPDATVARRHGRPYGLESLSGSTTWTRHADKLTRTDRDTKQEFTFDVPEVLTRPPARDWWERILYVGLRSEVDPALLLLSPIEEILDAYSVEISEFVDESGDLTIRSVYTPGTTYCGRQSVHFILDLHTYRPLHLRIAGTSRVNHSVYSFCDWSDVPGCGFPSADPAGGDLDSPLTPTRQDDVAK